MRTYRTTLTLSSASASKWQADTLWGHLCWSLVRHQGEESLQDFLEYYEEGLPPVLLSDGFPVTDGPEAEFHWLPRPRVAGLPLHAQAPARKADRVKEYRDRKRAAKAEWLTTEQFEKVRGGNCNVSPTSQPADTLRSVSKNRIDRITNTAGGGGGALFDFEERWQRRIDVYWSIEEGFESLVRNFLEGLYRTGYGKRKSVGYGQLLEVPALEPFDGFHDLKNANGFVTLSNFVPAKNDPVAGVWEAVVKYGKLGEEKAVAGQPFKRPLIQLAAGSCFCDTPVRDYYGRLVAGVATDEKVVQYGFALPVPMRIDAAGEALSTRHISAENQAPSDG